METLNSKDLVNLWESWDEPKKLHIDYGIYVGTSTPIYGAQGPKTASLSHWRLFLFHTKNGHSIV